MKPLSKDAKEVRPRPSVSHLFGRFATNISQLAGHPATFAIAVVLLLVWAACGPFVGYSTSWQLMVNTGTTICTFLMVFIIQNSQNRDGLAAQIKLDEIIRAIKPARNDMIDLENLSDEELTALQQKFSQLALKARNGKSPCDASIEEAREEVEEEIDEREREDLKALRSN